MRAKLRSPFALSAVVLTFALGLALAATAQASTTDTRYSSDGQWKATFTAFANSYIAYKSVGTEVHTYRWEWIHGTWFTSGHYGWVERPVARIVITNSYK